MEQYGNPSTYNLESVLKQNIGNSDYYRNDCSKLTTWEEVIDAIYDQVDYLEPWLAGNARGPSTAFCLLHRLFVLKPTEEQVRETITHQDSPYIRAIGFLYLRYVCPPRDLWEWLGPFCGDREEIQPSGPNGATVTLGDYVRDLLLEQYYYETIFPRIPKKVEDEIQAGLRSRGLPTKGVGNGGCGGSDRRGGDDGNRRPASVKASLSVAFGQRAPNRAGTKDTARFKAAEAAVGAGAAAGSRGVSRSRSRSREAPRRGGGATQEQQPQRERREYDYDSRDRDRQRDGDSRRAYDSRDRGYDRERGYDSRDRERGVHDSRGGRAGGYDSRDRERSASYYADRDRDRERGSSYRERERERDRSGGRERVERSREHGEYYGSSRRSRSRSRDRQGGGGGRDARDVFKDKAAAADGAGNVRSRYGDASGRLDLNSVGGGRRTADEVFRLGGRSYR